MRIAKGFLSFRLRCERGGEERDVASGKYIEATGSSGMLDENWVHWHDVVFSRRNATHKL